ncbi:hypothetical protein [Bythopirellula goksoeyrii]|uniref:hypothetical protein n=1 Tax=Bythopirellula goksoeyrii TaxID=1400387 RepID=UPI0011CE4CF2|nr:hypothetical protein [Bythopirellula goksoeyrii]
MTHQAKFIADGFSWATSAVRTQVQTEVTKKYASLIAHANFWDRFRLKQQINAEVWRRVAERVSPHALY